MHSTVGYTSSLSWYWIKVAPNIIGMPNAMINVQYLHVDIKWL
ncbi:MULTISPECIES: hypothetical protein [Vibrio]|nr:MULTISPECIES: hypothetical protein [Vibrio]MCR9811867.1 hypothetical protein [Vibrio parahaemolyticus]MDW2320273.1 hypothetical protein [Vibrio sp. 1159]